MPEKNISLIDLSKKLEAMGISETPQNINLTKINRGTFGDPIFMLQILKAIDCKIIIKRSLSYEHMMYHKVAVAKKMLKMPILKKLQLKGVSRNLVDIQTKRDMV